MNKDKYTIDFKTNVAKDRRRGMSIKEVAEKYRVAESSVYKWARLYSCGRLIQQEDPYSKEQNRQEAVQEKKRSIFRERQHKDKNGNRLRTVYPSSSAAYVTWDK